MVRSPASADHVGIRRPHHEAFQSTLQAKAARAFRAHRPTRAMSTFAQTAHLISRHSRSRRSAPADLFLQLRGDVRELLADIRATDRYTSFRGATRASRALEPVLGTLPQPSSDPPPRAADSVHSQVRENGVSQRVRDPLGGGGGGGVGARTGLGLDLGPMLLPSGMEPIEGRDRANRALLNKILVTLAAAAPCSDGCCAALSTARRLLRPCRGRSRRRLMRILTRGHRALARRALGFIDDRTQSPSSR